MLSWDVRNRGVVIAAVVSKAELNALDESTMARSQHLISYVREVRLQVKLYILEYHPM